VLRNEKVKVVAQFREQGSVLQGTQRGSCEGFSIELSVDSDEPAEAIAALMRLAHGMCFTEDALSRETKLTATHRLNGQPIEIASAQG